MKKLEAKGLIVFRTAGSHGIVDLIAIDKENSRIKFIQVKPKSMSKKAKERIQIEHFWLNGEFASSFQVVSMDKEVNENAL